VANRDKRGMIFPVKRLADLGFDIIATAGTGEVLRRHGIACEVVGKHYEVPGARHAVSLIASGEVSLVINTPQGSGASARIDGYEIRSAAVTADIPCATTMPGAAAAVMGIEALIRGEMSVRPLQEMHAALRAELSAGPGGGLPAGPGGGLAAGPGGGTAGGTGGEAS
jgi:carbamoyl-phosphate synthase large subunit